MFISLVLFQAQIDGNVVRARFTLPPRQKISPPPKAVASAPKRDGTKSDNLSAEKDGPKRLRERMLHMLEILYFISTCYLLCH